ncbi:MAG TPA: hypothetical protein PKW15_00860 [Alphaproteobacteria bacterium]|nr:hypothetical protein [Alphaproteobacteria bacterium]
MTESPEAETDPPTRPYRAKGQERPAQYRFLMLGVLLVIILATVLAFLNENVKEETAFQENLQAQTRSHIVPDEAAAGLAYEEAPGEEAPIISVDQDDVNSSENVLPEPTISAPVVE